MEQALSSYYIFYTAAECGSISKAAAKLFISQPAVSKSIQKLEDSLGCRLFLRSSRGVVLTEEGQLFYEHVKTAVDALTSGEEKIKHAASAGTGHLKIGVSATLCRYILLLYLQDFVKLNPNINISIICQSTSDTIRMLNEDKLDIGLIGTGSRSSTPALWFDYITDLEDIFVASSQYLQQLQQCGIPKTELLKNASLMLLDKNNITRQYIDEYLQKNQIAVQECIDASSMDLLIAFAKIHLGAACVIRQFIQPELSDGSLIEIPLPAPIEKRSAGFVYKKRKIMPKAMALFISFYSGRPFDTFGTHIPDL